MSPTEPGAPVPATAHLRHACASEAEATALLRALEPDHEGFVHATTEGSVLRLDVQAKSVSELRRTLEDTLACLSAAERTWGAAHARPTAAADPASSSDEEEDEGA